MRARLDGGPQVDPPGLDLHHRAALLVHPAVLDGGVAVGGGRQQRVLHCRRDEQGLVKNMISSSDICEAPSRIYP